MTLETYYFNEVKYPLPDNLLSENSYKDWVYLIKNVDTQTYKIGITNKVKTRRNQIETATGCNIKIIIAIELIDAGDEAPELVEKLLFNYYKEKRLKGEWFNLSNNDINDIKELFYKLDGDIIEHD